jgi:TolB-like protein
VHKARRAGRKAAVHKKYAVVASVLLVAVALFFVVNPFNIELRTADPIAAENTIGVVGFENLSDPDDRERLGRVLVGLIVTDLAESGGLRVASTSKVLVAYKAAGGRVDSGFDGALASETARLAGIRTMLTGQVIQSGDQLILTVELVDVTSGNTLGSLRRDAASSAELFALAGDLPVPNIATAKTRLKVLESER